MVKLAENRRYPEEVPGGDTLRRYPEEVARGTLRRYPANFSKNKNLTSVYFRSKNLTSVFFTIYFNKSKYRPNDSVIGLYR